LHSWSVEAQEEVVKKLKPRDFIFEKAKQFQKPSFRTYLKEITKKILGKSYEIQRINNIYSRWYSFKKVCQLVKKSGQKYDLIIVTRFDMCLLSEIDLKEVNKENFYSGNWITYREENKDILEENYLVKSKFLKSQPKGYPFDNEGLQDFFFISSKDYMLDSFSNIYNQLKFLIKKYGASNHLIAFGKLKEDKSLQKHERILTYSKDYFLSRWL
jgi:hypothetical protein